MRKFVIIILLSISLLSCKSINNKDENLSIFRYNETAGILTLDPAFAKDLPHIWACNQLYNNLIDLDDSLNIIPELAKSWSISTDGLTYTFTLRNDVYFHHDSIFKTPRKLIASDVVYSFNRLVDKTLNSPGAWIFSAVQHNDSSYAFKSLNDSVLQITLSKPFPPFLGILSMTYASIIPHEVVSFYGSDFRRHPIGTGPFQFQYWKEGVKMVFRKNPNYFEIIDGQRLPYIDAVSISFLIDKQVAFLEFVKGKFDFMSGIDSRYKDELLTYEGQLRKKYCDKIYLIRQPYLNTEYLSFYIENDENIDEEKFLALRQAINLAIDREKMIRYLRNSIGIPADGGIIPAGLPGHQSLGIHYDFNKAQKLINDYKLNNFAIKLSTTADYADIGKFVQSQLSEIGLQCSMEIIPPATLRTLRANGSLPFFRASWVADYPDAENYLSLFTTKNFAPIGPNYSHYSNVSFDTLYNKSMHCTELNERKKIYAQMDSLMMTEVPVVVLFYDEVLRFVNQRVSNLGSNPINLLDLRKVKITKNKNNNR